MGAGLGLGHWLVGFVFFFGGVDLGWGWAWGWGWGLGLALSEPEWLVFNHFR